MSEEEKAVVYIVEDDASVREALELTLLAAGIEAQTFASAREFLSSKIREQNACLIVDVQMPEITGLQLHQKLIARSSKLPVIYITAFDTKETRHKARELGAFAYFRKPLDDQALHDIIQFALSSDPSMAGSPH